MQDVIGAIWVAFGLISAAMYLKSRIRDGEITLGDIVASTLLFMIGPCAALCFFAVFCVAAAGEIFNNIHLSSGMDDVIWRSKEKEALIQRTNKETR